MIQRIQSIFLLVAVIVSALLFFFPIETNLSQTGLTDFYKLMVYDFILYKQGIPPVHDYLITLPMLIANALVLVLSFYAILLYKKRIRQMKMVKIAAFVNILLIFGIFFGYSRIIAERVEVASVSGEFSVGAFFPLITLVMLVIAFRRIRYDENLVRSAERLR